MKTLSNGLISISVKEHGAELSSIRCNDKEYLWQADPAFWKRHSPVLFPIVGSVWNGEYRVDGNTFALGQHGFARDMDFELLSETDDAVFYVLESNEDTLKKFPFAFRLEIGYKIYGKNIDVIWRVINPSTQELPFQIGAHPAFYWPKSDEETLKTTTSRGYFRFDSSKDLVKSVITEKGCVDPDASAVVKLNSDGTLKLDTSTFDNDALVIERDQIHAVTLMDDDKIPYLTVKFAAPLVGLWSPPHKNAPFVCIEPWYGRCDRVHYTGEYKDKDWIQVLKDGETFESVYTITIE